MQQREPNYQLCLPMFSEALAKNLFDLFPRDARHPHAARAGDARTSREWFLNVNQSVVRRGQTGARRRCFFSPALPLMHLSPPYVVCRDWSGPGFARRVDHNRCQGRCVTAPPGLPPLCLPRPDEEPDLWQNETGSVSLRQAGRSQTNSPTVSTHPQLTQTWRDTGRKKKKIIWLTYPSACWLLSVILHLHGIIIFSPLPFVDSSEFESI